MRAESIRVHLRNLPICVRLIWRHTDADQACVWRKALYQDAAKSRRRRRASVEGPLGGVSVRHVGYSRSTSAGSVRTARSAGATQAATTATVSTTEMPISVTGSVVATP